MIRQNSADSDRKKIGDKIHLSTKIYSELKEAQAKKEKGDHCLCWVTVKPF